MTSRALTVTERSVLDAVARGLTNKEIAKSLQRSPATVHAHLASVYLKLGVNGRKDAAALA